MSTDKDSSKSIFDKLFECVNSGVIWSIIQTKSACPPKKKKSVEEHAESRKESGDDPDAFSSKKYRYLTPSQICPAVKPCCVIKMQDPCAPCCCEDKPKPPPCPPRHGPQKPREPVCGCDLCQKNGGNEKCCDRNRGFRGISLDPRYFEKA